MSESYLLLLCQNQGPLILCVMMFSIYIYVLLDKSHSIPNGVDSRVALSQHNSLNQADDNFSPYARVREHPYDKVRKVEHPYAVVQSSSSQEQDSSGKVTPRTAPLR